jgi:hypothetical protein
MIWIEPFVSEIAVVKGAEHGNSPSVWVVQGLYIRMRILVGLFGGVQGLGRLGRLYGTKQDRGRGKRRMEVK